MLLRSRQKNKDQKNNLTISNLDIRNQESQTNIQIEIATKSEKIEWSSNIIRNQQHNKPEIQVEKSICYSNSQQITI